MAYEFVYRVLLSDGTYRLCDEIGMNKFINEYNADVEPHVVCVKRIELHESDWKEVTAVTMMKLRSAS